MQTHDDNQHAREFLDRLIRRADESRRTRASEITTGKPGEKPLAKKEDCLCRDVAAELPIEMAATRLDLIVVRLLEI